MMGTVMSSHKKSWKVQALDQPDMPTPPRKIAEQPSIVSQASTDPSLFKDKDLTPEQEEKREKWVHETADSMEYLQSSDDYATEECLKIYETLKKSSTIKPKKNRVLLGDHLLSVGYVEIFSQMWNDLNSYQMYAEDPPPKAKQAHTNLKRMLMSYWNFTDCSDNVCTEFGKLKCLDCLIEGLKDPEYSVDKLGNDGKRYVVKAILGIMHNCCRRIRKNRERCYGCIDSLQELTTSTYLIVRAKAFIVLAYVAKKSEIQKLETNDACIKFLLKMIEEAMSYKNHVTKKYSFSAAEILQGLNQLALNDGNKTLIVELGGLPLIAKMLEDGCSDDEKTMAASTIWQLAFMDENKEKIRQDQELIKSLMLLKNCDNPAIRDASTGALWEVYESKVPFGVHNEKTDSPVNSSLESLSDSPHIMISYQWDSQDLVIKIRDMLQNAGYNVWMDIDKMAGDILGAMAQAVEHASLVLVCMTQKYAESHNGRTEATYTYKLKKPIIPLQLEEGYEGEGWLGALVGTLLYFKMYSTDVASESFSALIKEIGDRGKMPKKISVKHNGIRPQRSIMTTSSPPSSPPPRPAAPALPAKSYSKGSTAAAVSRWGPEQVRAWLESNNLLTLHTTLTQLNGEQLVQMRKQLSRAPEFFHRSLRDDLGLSFVAILTLTAALDKLPI